MTEPGQTADVAVIGAGAAGLMTAISCAREAPAARVVLLDGARTIGAKILVSGGGRCNVTNTVVTERDYWGGSPATVRRILRAFPAARTVAFFSQLGVSLHEEEDGKLFPDSNRARSILEALIGEATARGVRLHSGTRVDTVTREAHGFVIATGSAGCWRAGHVALATGGRSLPRSGSDGHGYAIATTLGHQLVATTPALVPLVLDDPMHELLSGVSHPGEITVWVDRRVERRLGGALLWTHFGASGPLVLNTSRHWLRATLEQQRVELTLNCLPGETYGSCDEWLRAVQQARPRASVTTVLAERLPASLAAVLAQSADLQHTTLAHLGRDERRRLVRLLTEQTLAVRDSRGYNYAEVTAGGVALDEIDPGSMESRRCPGLYLTGEILDVDGRLGGFNFQWAWSTGAVAGAALARRLRGGQM